MSLIDDALKRAQEAGASGEARTAERPWTPTPMPDPGLARAARLRRILGVVALAAAAAAGVYVFLLRAAPDAPEKAASAAAPTSPPAPIAELATPFPVVIVPTPPRATRAVARPVVSPQAAAALPPADVAASVPAPPPAAAPAPAPQPGSPRTYAGSVALPGGAKIELGGIVWNDTEPRALVNDRIVAVGGYVEGYSVSKIETDRIELEKDGVTIVVTVK